MIVAIVQAIKGELFWQLQGSVVKLKERMHIQQVNNPFSSRTSVVTLVEASMATPSETSVPMPHQDQDRLQVLPIYGCRIVNVAELSKAIYELTAHSTSCEETCLLYSG